MAVTKWYFIVRNKMTEGLLFPENDPENLRSIF
jgi:hypothetical protein